MFDAVSLMIAQSSLHTGRPIYTINGKATKQVSEEQIGSELAVAKIASVKKTEPSAGGGGSVN
jgi:hypothetical protein